MKGISPLIAIVLIIAIVVAVSGIVGLFFTTYTSSQTKTVGSLGEAQFKCAASSLSVKEVRVPAACPTTPIFVNITIGYDTGSETLYNLTYEVTGGGNTNVTLIPNSVLIVGMINATSINVTAGSAVPTCPFELVRVRALCQNKTSIISECKPADGCWKPI